MKLLAVHPSCLMYSKIYLRLEPLGLELVAAACQEAGHEVRIIDLQAETHRDYFRIVDQWQPDVIAYSCNYLANVPEILDLAKATRTKLPRSLIVVGGHSASFTAQELLEHGGGALDCILKGEGEPVMTALLEAAQSDRASLHKVPGVVTLDGEGPRPGFVESLDNLLPARDLLRHRRRYFIGVLDPCASIEFSRGCPWDCVFCSAWTFYGRSYRTKSPERVIEELATIREPGVFLLDDVAFIQAEHGMRIGEMIASKGIRKQYYLETRGDILLRNKEVFQFWRKIGLEYMFLGIEAIDEEGLKQFRKRVSLSKNFEALDFARSLGISVAINIIADPSWDRERFKVIRDWCMEIPEIVNISVNTPYPGTESWRTESRNINTRDYRLFDIQHAV
ncbi:MAG: hopanoid C-3 methylase HpnR, partial [Chthoniobacterales bacterium]